MQGSQANAREAERLAGTKRSATAGQNKYNPTRPSKAARVVWDGRNGTARKAK
jgi:hypothetical protein